MKHTGTMIAGCRRSGVVLGFFFFVFFLVVGGFPSLMVVFIWLGFFFCFYGEGVLW